MRCVAVLLILVPAALCALQPEGRPRPSRRGYSAIQGVCDRGSGAMDNGERSGRDGTLKACSDRCNDMQNCNGFNYFTDQNQCLLFETACEDTQTVERTQPTQNFYLKGEIACSTSTVGKEFWVAFMANRVAKPQNMSLELWITQDQVEPESIVTLESHPSRGITRQVRVPYKQAVKTLIPFDWKVTDEDNGVNIERKALKLSSDDDFVFYGVNKEYFTADAYLGIPSRALGTRYVANCFWPPFYNCEFAFTPTEDNTRVTITLPRTPTRNTGNWAAPPDASSGIARCQTPYNGNTYTNGDTFTITVNRFEVAQIQDQCDLTGAIIESDKTIAVWSGDSRVNIGDAPSRDHQVEELFSTDTWGTDCAAWPTPNRTPGLVDYWVITANSDNTVITADSNEHPRETYSLNAGESVRFPAHSVNEYMRFTSDKKFQAAKYASSATDNRIPGDPAMTLCIPTDQFGFGYTFVTPTGVSSPYNNYLSIITTQGAEDGFMLDNQPITLERWTNFPNSNLVGGFIQLDGSRQQFRIEHRVKGTTFEAYIYGAGDRESIAYPTGACIKALGECVPSNMVIADGKDNDCDGVIDEELWDGIDNDFDGQVDEDCYDRKKIPDDRCPEVLEAKACYNGNVELSCDSGSIHVLDAHFGRLSRGGEMSCGSENAMDACSGTDADCGWADVSGAFASCNGQVQCSQKVTYSALANMYPSTKCPTCALYAQVQYACLNDKEQTHGVREDAAYSGSSWMSASGGGTCPATGAGGDSYTSSDCPGCMSMTKKSSEAFHPSSAPLGEGQAFGWCAAPCDWQAPWLSIDLGASYRVGWYAVSGCRKSDHWVTSFGISYSQDGKDWSEVRSDEGGLKSFTANSDANTVKMCTLFGYDITARHIRVHPLSWNDGPCMHIDFGRGAEGQGCSKSGVAHSNFDKANSAAFGTAARVECNRGWTTGNGEKSYEVQCGSDGHWGGDFKPCNRVLTCPDIPRIEGGYAKAGNTLVGSRVTFACLNGRRLQGSYEITCQDNGQWSDAAPSCQ